MNETIALGLVVHVSVGNEVHARSTIGIEYEDKANLNFHADLHDNGKKVTIKTGKGKWISVSNIKTVHAADTQTDDSKFHLEEENGKYSLRTHDGKYLGTTGANRVILLDKKDKGAYFTVHNPY